MTVQDNEKNAANTGMAIAGDENPLSREGGVGKPPGDDAVTSGGLMSCDSGGGGFSDSDPLRLVPKANLLCGGRPAVLTAFVKDQICQLLALGASRREAAKIVDVHHSTIGDAAERDEDFARSMERAELLADLQPRLLIAAAGRKDWRAAAWLLAHRAKYPARQTEEEKLQAHQERIADERRLSEYLKLSDEMREERDEAAKARREARELAARRAEIAERYPPRKKRTKPPPSAKGAQPAA